jgi:hypothetical protein
LFSLPARVMYSDQNLVTVRWQKNLSDSNYGIPAASTTPLPGLDGYLRHTTTVVPSSEARHGKLLMLRCLWV